MVIAEMSVSPLGTGRAYTVIKLDERRDGDSRSAEDMGRSVEESETR